MKWFIKLSQNNANVSIDISEYLNSIKSRYQDMLNFQQLEFNRLQHFTFDQKQLDFHLQSGQYPAINNILNAIKSNDPSELSDAIWELNAYWRGIVKNRDSEQQSHIYKAFKMLRDYEKWLEMKSGTGQNITPELAESEINDLATKTTENMEKIAGSIRNLIGRINNWNGSFVQIIADEVYKESEVTPQTTCHIRVGNGEMAPEFMYFEENGKIIVDDIAESGDFDVFSTPQLQADYFGLINTIQNPNGGKKKKKLRLFTAHPTKDRMQFQNATMLPSNIFLCNQLDHTIGLGTDLSSGNGRDIWEVSLDSDYGLIRTLDPNSPDNPYKLQYYQTTTQVPIKGIWMIQSGDNNTLNNNPQEV